MTEESDVRVEKKGAEARPFVPREEPSRKKVTGVTKWRDIAATRGIDKKALLKDASTPLARKRVHTRVRLAEEAARRKAMSEVLLTESSGLLETEVHERPSGKMRQCDLLALTDAGTHEKLLDLRLPHGPFKMDFSANGSHMLLGSSTGHLSLMNLLTFAPHCELHSCQSLRALKILHGHALFATAQRKYVHIYDHTGAEVHCLRDCPSPVSLEYLRHHFLLVDTTAASKIQWQDISTGRLVATHSMARGPSPTTCLNPWNAVIHVGHSRGTVTLWTPNLDEPCMIMKAHSGPVTALGVSADGRYMTSAGSDQTWRLWDLRGGGDRALQTYTVFGPPVTSLDISGTGLVAAANGIHVKVWKDVLTGSSERQKLPYLHEEFPGCPVESVRFRPMEDLLAVGHAKGLSTMLVPGAGVANIDTFAANPYETKKQRRERDIRQLLEKLPAESICLDPGKIGQVDMSSTLENERRQRIEEERRLKMSKRKGFSTAREKRKQRAIEEKLQERNSGCKEERQRAEVGQGSALNRFRKS